MTQGAGRDVWLVLPDELSIRVFFDTGIVDGLRERLGRRLRVVFGTEPNEWAERVRPGEAIDPRELMPAAVGLAEKVVRRADRWLDRQIGYYPLAIRLNERFGFHATRMRPGHPNWMLDVDRRDPLPGGARVEAAMKRWYLSPRRYVPSALERRLRLECRTLVLANVQPHSVTPFLLGARRVGVPTVGYIASWDHTVGKGVITPHLDRYVVQNDVMRADLARFHGIGPERVIVTGWPQTDVFHQPRPTDAYVALLRQYELDPTLPLVAIMGNTPSNAPYEGRFVERLVLWWQESSRGRFSLLVRPHPRDGAWRDRFSAALDVDGIHVQEASYTDLDELATLLQHASAVVSNAGTILLDAIVNDRPSVCVLYDEGAPAGETWASENVAGAHYRELVQSDAFYRAHDFDEVTAGIERALTQPSELADERARVAREVVGDVDGRAADRVVEAIAETVG